MEEDDGMQGCPICGYWQCGGCGDYDPAQLERESFWEEEDV